MTLQGLDCSHWQSGLNLAKSGTDFAIMKATEGTWYVDSTCNGFVSQAKKAGIPWGVYCFHDAGVGPNTEADFFLKHVADYIGHGLLVLDWESTDTGSVSTAKAWLDRVYAKTGIRAAIYMSQSVAASHDWSSVEKYHALWVARYNESIGSTGGWPVTMWQYTSSGHLPGYSGSLDLDHFYGTRDTWAAFVAGADAVPSPDNDEDTDGDQGDDMPKWKNTQRNADYTIPGDGEWRTLKLDDDDALSFLTGPLRCNGVLAVSVTGVPKDSEIDLRPLVVNYGGGKDTTPANSEPATQFVSAGGTTQMTIPFAQDLAGPAGGQTKRLRFQIKAYGGQTATVTWVQARATYWD